MDIEKLREIVKNKLPKKRYIHTLGVEKVCVELAKKYGDTKTYEFVNGVLARLV